MGRLNILDVRKVSTPDATMFSEEIVYDAEGFASDPGSLPKYNNGNIAGVRYLGTNTAQSGYGEKFQYSYDPLARLTGTAYIDESSAATGTDRYSSSHAYHVDGNIGYALTHRQDPPGGTSVVAQSALYDYHPGTHKLKAIDGSLRGITETGTETFIYDSNGNMIEDKTKKLSIEYDWRNMPIRFVMKNSSGKIVHVSQVLYDASGSRVAKYEFTRN
jgi:hypothetical protein